MTRTGRRITNMVRLYLVVAVFTLASVHGGVPPSFDSFPPSVFIAEDQTPGARIAVIRACDADGDDLSLMIGGDTCWDILELGTIKRYNGCLRGLGIQANITLKRSLDRETKPQYNIIIQVSDGVNKAKREMGVFVTDINDNTPSFMNLPNYIHIKEDTPLGRIIYQVTALDLDTGMGGLITYSILLQNPSDIAVIDSNTGIVTLSKSLRYSEVRTYIIIIKAKDGGGLYSLSELEIHVQGKHQNITDNSYMTIAQTTCYSCTGSPGNDCHMEQLQCSRTTVCSPEHYCYMHIRTDQDTLKYYRGCMPQSSCPSNTTRPRCFEGLQNSRNCTMCCKESRCNGYHISYLQNGTLRTGVDILLINIVIFIIAATQ